MDAGMGVGSSSGVADGAAVWVGSLVCVEGAVNVGGSLVGVSVAGGEVGVSAGGSLNSLESVGVFPELARTLTGESGLHPATTNMAGIKYKHNWINRVLEIIGSLLLHQFSG
jgi:hypothetical protein